MAVAGGVGVARGGSTAAPPVAFGVVRNVACNAACCSCDSPANHATICALVWGRPSSGSPGSMPKLARGVVSPRYLENGEPCRVRSFYGARAAGARGAAPQVRRAKRVFVRVLVVVKFAPDCCHASAPRACPRIIESWRFWKVRVRAWELPKVTFRRGVALLNRRCTLDQFICSYVPFSRSTTFDRAFGEPQ